MTKNKAVSKNKRLILAIVYLAVGTFLIESTYSHPSMDIVFKVFCYAFGGFLVFFGGIMNLIVAITEKNAHTQEPVTDAQPDNSPAMLESAPTTSETSETTTTTPQVLPLNIPDTMITKKQFNDLRTQVLDIVEFIKMICYEAEFQKFIKDITHGSASLSNSYEIFENFRIFGVKDILRNYERLGHKYYTKLNGDQKTCYIDTDTHEGQMLYCIISMIMKYDNGSKYHYNEFRQELNGEIPFISHELLNIMRQALDVYANADMDVTASDGHEDFYFCMILDNYNKDYVKQYRVKMLRIATLIAKADNRVTEQENDWLDAINGSIAQPAKEENTAAEPGISPDEQLKQLIGLKSVKEQLQTLRNFVAVKQHREQAGMKSPSITYHCVFTGNPGTGKTTVARILAAIYKDLGIIKKGHLVETDRSGLVAEYVGQTAVKTNKIIDSALDGVLFIDEAYTLVGAGANDYGMEAIATLLKRMEDDRDRLIVILAGYTGEMEDFITSNPGLRSRFNRYIEFPDYSPAELHEIFLLQATKNDFELSEKANERLKEILENAVAHKDKDFGNARFVRNLFEKTIEAQANRLSAKPQLTKEDLILITENDISQNDE